MFLLRALSIQALGQRAEAGSGTLASRSKIASWSLTVSLRNRHNAGDMLIQKIDQGWVIRSPAKVNLFLDVLGKREDGYHQIDTIMCPVTLFDELRFESRIDRRIDFSVEFVTSTEKSGFHNDPAWIIPPDSSNLVVRALEAVQAELGLATGCCVTLQKRIPASAGLGGGSSDAAAAIVAGLIGWARWDRQIALRVAAKLGSDIPLFLGDVELGIGLARATGRGETVKILPGKPPVCLVITHPPVGSSTAEVYKSWKPELHEYSSVAMMGAILRTDGRLDLSGGELRVAIEPAMFNALQSVAGRSTDWIARQLELFAKLGKPKAMMTGSGSACIALVDNLKEGQAIAEKMIELGLPRAFAVEAWYATPIETQLERIDLDLP